MTEQTPMTYEHLETCYYNAKLLIQEQQNRLKNTSDEIRRLREENEQLKEELDSHEAWKAVSEMAQRESEHLRKQQQKLIEALEWIRDAGTDYQSINKAREALKVIEHEQER